MIQRTFMIFIILLIILFGGLYAYKQLIPPEVTETQGPIYSTQKVIKGDISVGVEVVGQLNPTSGGGIRVPEPVDSTDMSIQYLIDEYFIEEGDEVKQGQVVARLLSADLDTQIQNISEQLETEQKTLSDMIGIPIENLDTINANQGIEINAPIEGKINNLSVVEGQKIEQGKIIAHIVDDSKFKVNGKITPSEFKLVKEGQTVLLRFPYFDGFYKGTITNVNPNAMPDNVNDSSNEQFGTTFVHLITIEGKNPGLVQPGMEVSISLPNDENDIYSTTTFKYKGIVESYVKEDKIINQLNNEVIVTKVHVHEMQVVKKGDPIITMAGSDVTDMIQEKLDKIRELKNKLRSLKSKLEQLEIKAPMDGVVAGLYRQPGETVRPGEWIGDVFNTSSMRMWTQVDDVDVLLIKQDAPVKVTVDALPGETFEGKVTTVSTMGRDVNGITRFTVHIEVKGGPKLRPGMQARAYIDAGSAKNVLLVPLEAIFEEDGVSKIEVLNEDGTTKVVTVKIGLMNDKVAEIKSGLKEGELVITGSTADLLPSQHIKSQDTLLPTDQDNNQESNQNEQNNNHNSN